MRVRITFAKTAAMKYTGHLDLYRAWERLIRRAGLPLAYTQGFSPHPRINLASALPLGFTGEAEMIDIWLAEVCTLPECATRLREAAPPGIEMRLVEAVDEKTPALQSVVEASEYVITLLENVEGLEERLATVLEKTEIRRERRGKVYDLRPLILGAEVIQADEDGRQRLRAYLMAREGATGRPEELLAELGVEAVEARVHRRRIVFAKQGC